jgi:hypothetical protein
MSDLIPEEAWALLISEPSVEETEHAAALIVAAELERLVGELERWGRASRNLGFTDYAEGKADGIEVTVTHLRERVAVLRGGS